jgi:hypothetical protein
MSFNRHLIGSLALAAIVAPSLASADAPAAKWYDKLSLTGNVDAYYQQSLNETASTDYLSGQTGANTAGNLGNTSNIGLRAFDNRANSFQYSADLNLTYSDDASKTGATVELVYGAKAAIINLGNAAIESAFYNNGNPYSSYFTSSNIPGYTVAQAFAKQGYGPLTLSIGKFATPVGYETWNSTANANYSRSVTYQQEPLFSTGAKLDYAAPAGIGASVWLDNGNSIDYSVSDAKNWGVALSYSGIKNLSVNAQWYEDQTSAYSLRNGIESFGYKQVYWSGSNYFGYENSQYSAGFFDTTHFIDLNVQYQVLASLQIAGEYLYKTVIDGSSAIDRASYGWQTDAYSPKMQSFALYATYNTPINNLSVSGRWEQVNSPDALSAGTTVSGVTVGLPFLTLDTYTGTVKYVAGPLTHVLEYRADAANTAVFHTDGNYHAQNTPYYSNNYNWSSAALSQIQQTITYAAVYNF